MQNEKKNQSLLGPLRVLLIDDDSVMLGLISDALFSLKYEVITAGDGEKGLKLIRQEGNSIDIILTDLKHPKIDGAKMSRIIKKEFPDIPILLITGYHSAIKKLESEGIFFKILPKPFRIRVMEQSIKEALGVKGK